MEMKRFGLLLLVLAAAAGFATPSNGATIVALNDGAVLGDNIWDLTVETSLGDSNDLGGQLSIDNAVSFAPNLAVCDGTNIVICVTLTAADLGDATPSLQDNLFFIIAVVQAGALDGGVPRLLGQVTSNGLPALTTAGIDVLTGIPGNTETFTSTPVTFINPVPEPAAMAFVAMALGSLALLRRRAA
jgi:hypothetical protein